MPDEFEFKKYKKFEEFEESIEGYRYYHDVYLKAINHPIRREILKAILEENNKKITEEGLYEVLKNKGIIKKREVLKYNLDYLKKAFCVEIIKDENSNKQYYQITQSGKIIEYLNKL
jgi:hypothetical protein